ncbi:tail fiber protein, partial [Acinetobacter lwoffii]|uniref:tail fiber protein n=1 Tax=Acinetobacter lwoffii TaxID=28090 RepID=UPI00209ABF20
NNSAGTYGANNLEIPTFTLNKKGLLTSAGNRAFPYAGVGQYGAAILYDGIDSYSTSHAVTANAVRFLGERRYNRSQSSGQSFDLSRRDFDGVHTEYTWRNGPTNNIGAVQFYNYSQDWIGKIFFDIASHKLYTQTFTNGTTHSAWREIAYTDSFTRYKQDSDATRIHSPNSQKVLEVTDTDVRLSDLIVYGRLLANNFASDSPYSFLTGNGQQQVVMTGGILASDSYAADQGKVHGLGIYAKGVIESAAGFKGKLLAKDSRILKPFNAESGGISAYFVTEWGLNNDYVGGNYGDFLSINTYHDASAGNQNGLFFDKTGKRIVHYQSGWGAANWGYGKTLAYAEDVLSTNGGTMNAPINFNLSHADGAFHKLIEGITSTDGGYIAVGNHGSDKGYLELGTTDDADAAIYARKRNAANTVLEEAVILGPDGNTSFPHSVFIHNAVGGYGSCGMIKGNADGASYAGCNIDITSWFGVGIKSSNSGERTVVFNARTGDISNRGSLHTEQWVNAKGLGVNSTEGTGHGLSLHGGTAGGMPNYGISFAQTYHYGTCGYVNGDWATYFTMTGGNNRGWIFRHADLGNVASISSQGLLSIPTMKMDRSNFQIEHYSTFSIYYDFATRIVRIVMKVQSAAGIGTADSPFKFVDNRYTAKFSLPITLQLRLSAEFHFNNVGPGYTPWHEEAAEWHAWCAPVGLRGSTESAVNVDIMRWTGSKGEAIDGYLIVTGFF